MLQERSRCAGTIALEYILIAALVGIALIGTFHLWGQVTAKAIRNTAGDARGAVEKEP